MQARFGRLAKHKRLEAEISLRLVARQLELTPAYISDIERGHRNPPAPEIVQKWALIVGGDPDLFDRVARLDRSIIEFPVENGGEDSPRNDVLIALARRWTSLSEAKVKELKSVLENADVD